MFCRTARRSVIREAAGVPGAAERSALARHLGRCASCRAEAELERRITEDLGSLRLESSVEIDVRQRVLARLAALPADRVEVPTWQLGLAAGSALAGAVALLAVLWLWGAEMGSAIAQTLRLLTSLAEAARTTASTLAGLLLIPLRLGLFLLSALPKLATRFEPVAIGSIAVGYAFAAAFVVYILGRDLRATGAPPE